MTTKYSEEDLLQILHPQPDLGFLEAESNRTQVDLNLTVVADDLKRLISLRPPYK